MSDQGTSVGFIVQIGSSIGSVLALLAFWTRFSDRITIAGQKADSAQQEAAEAKNDMENFRGTLDTVSHDIERRIDGMRRDDGEALAAIRQHVTDLAMFMRDNFVRNLEFSAAMSKIEAGQIRLETKLDRVSEQMRKNT